MRAFRHYDINFYNELCHVFPSFAKRFQKACEEQWENRAKYVRVSRQADNFGWSIDIPKYDIYFLSALALNKWYCSEFFDGNPNRYYIIVENCSKNKYLFTTKIDTLPDWAVRFMYVKGEE